ncbi:hypothetical protein Moror_8147 [Moniliophthora roreri MCA 2997]|uniref:Peroxisome membrane anchor protein Pex14p N-terminal domain-containing protein n=2 Tax=Moniliophthora roreri TaxID=221103 RepID=V2YS40_MONRO|nr:hypothetical protein Moror_8147 [Moniliophthora roreri MCA 2997]KAI3612271.1 hypothetical protein WG66_012295 [Moniliophthora roreri]
MADGTSSQNTSPNPQNEVQIVEQKSPQEQAQPSVAASPAPNVNTIVDRSGLLSRARAFLRAPQIQSQDLFAKRKFLIDKGLNEPEIELLLRELPPQLPTVPPRTYPQPPPSNLPTLLLGLLRIFSWIAGGSALLLFIYQRLLLPRIIRTSQARKSLKLHQLSLLKKLQSSATSLKAAQAETFPLLPRLDPHGEPSAYGDCHSLGDVLQVAEKTKLEVRDLPQVTLLRSGIEEFRSRSELENVINPTTEELFRVLESRIPWLVSEDGIAFEHKLWDTLTTSPLFESSKPAAESDSIHQPAVHWAYRPPEPQPTPPLMASLDALSSNISQGRPTIQTSPAQRTLQSASELTGYISTQVYVPYRPFGTNPSSSPAEEEIRKEIKALKGLVLNRRSFMPSIPRVNSSSSSS